MWLGLASLARRLRGLDGLRKRFGRHAAWWVVGVLALLSAGVRIQTAEQKQCVVHDEAVTLIAAAGKLNDYGRQRRKLMGHWVPASRWKQFEEITEPWVFGKIHDGATRTDVHPPLYYWLLHVAGVVAGGLSPRTGAILNTLLHMVGLLLVFALVRRTTGRAGWALFATALWTFSAAVLSTTFVARQYELLAVLGLGTTWTLLMVFSKAHRAWPWSLLLVLLLAAALLTHLHGALLVGAVVATGLFGLAQHAAKRLLAVPPTFPWRRAALALAAPPLAIGLFLAVHPGVFEQIEKLRGREQHLSEAGIEQRWSRTASALLSMFDLGEYGGKHANVVMLLVAALCLMPLGVVLFKFVRTKDSDQAARLAGTTVLSIFLLTIAGGTLGSYLGFMSQRHAMGDRYLALMWPFLAISLAITGWLLAPRAPPAVTGVLVVAMLLLGVRWRAHSPYLCDGRLPYGPDLQLADNVIVDTSARGHLGQLLPQIRPEARLLVAEEDDLRRHEGALLKGLEKAESATLIHIGGYGVSSRDRKLMLRLAKRAHFEVETGGGLTALLAPDPNRVTLMVGRGDLRNALSARFLRAAREAGGTFIASPSKGASVWLLRGGRVLAERSTRDGRLVLEGTALAKAGMPGSLRCTANHCDFALGDARGSSSEDGLTILVRSSNPQRTVFRTQLAPDTMRHVESNFWYAAKPRHNRHRTTTARH